MESTGAPGYELVDTWQSAPDPAPGGVLDPVDLAIGGDGTAYVVDAGLRRVQPFAADGTPLEPLGVPGGDPAAGGLRSPFGIALDEARERLFVSDRQAGQLAVFDAEGRFSEAWGEFQIPEAIAIAPGGRVYVYDRAAHSIKPRGVDGTVEDGIPVPRAQSTFALLPNGLAIDPAGLIWFVSEAPARDQPPVIWVYRPDGNPDPPRTQVPWTPRDVSIEPGTGRVYFLDGSGARLVSDFVRASPPRFSAAAIDRDVRAIDAAGAAVVHLLNGPTADAEGGVTRVRYDGRTLRELGRFDFPPIEPGWLSLPMRVVAGRDGRVYVVDEMNRAQRFRPDGGYVAHLRRIGMKEVDATAGGDWIVARIRSSTSIDDPEDPDVAPPGTWRIRVERYPGDFDPAAPRPRWSLDWTEPVDAPVRTAITALAHDPARDRVYALDATGQRIIVVGLSDGRKQADWPLPRVEAVVGYHDLDVAPDGRLLALTTSGRRVVVLSPDGGAAGEIPVPPLTLRFAPLPGGGIVAATAAREILWIEPDGDVAHRVALPPPARGDPAPPSDVALDAAGRVYVSDREGRAVYVFAPPGGGAIHLPTLRRNDP